MSGHDDRAKALAEATTPFELDPNIPCNTPLDVLKANIEHNIRLGLPQLYPHGPNPDTALLVCGGPSLKETQKDLVQAIWRGGKVVATNGAYNWCLKKNIRPSAMVMLDAREFNARFLGKPVPECKYLLAAQCHPKAFEKCRGREVYIWHSCTGGQEELGLLEEYYFKRIHPFGMGTTVAIRALEILRALGFRNIEIFGLDSCWLKDKHHAYPQPENDRLTEQRNHVWLRYKNEAGDYFEDVGEEFVCSPWHLKQLTDFQELIAQAGNSFNLVVHGPGLIATMIRTGASLPTEEGT